MKVEKCSYSPRFTVHNTGTVQSNRKRLPDQVKKPKLKLNETVAYQKDSEIMALSFRDKRTVTMLSTYYGPNCDEIEQVNKGGEKIKINKPIAIQNYTKFMGGIDRADQYCGPYGFTRKTYKWWRKLFFWLVEVCIVNSFILYKLDQAEK